MAGNCGARKNCCSLKAPACSRQRSVRRSRFYTEARRHVVARTPVAALRAAWIERSPVHKPIPRSKVVACGRGFALSMSRPQAGVTGVMTALPGTSVQSPSVRLRASGSVWTRCLRPLRLSKTSSARQERAGGSCRRACFQERLGLAAVVQQDPADAVLRRSAACTPAGRRSDRRDML